MYYLIAYDISSPRRLQRMLKMCRRYLKWVQNSLFEGELTETQFAELRKDIMKLSDKETDCVLFYALRDQSLIKRELYGREKNSLDMIF